jgi:hypothetical protein
MAPTSASEGKRVAIIWQSDAFANGIRPPQLKRFLEQRGHDVSMVDTHLLSRASQTPRTLASKLPGWGLRTLALYLIEAAAAMFTRRWVFGRRHLSYYVLIADYRLRRTLLASTLPLDDFDLVICETPYDAGVLTVPTRARTLYDCPAPWADELLFEGRLTDRQHAKLRRLEIGLFERVDHLAFHWESYAQYARERYPISGRNLVKLNFGCTPQAERANHSDPVRVVYLGNLSARFNNPNLLARLAALYPHIDVFGGPPPDPRLGLNYLGYTPSLDVLRNYQAGLITVGSDPLRQYGFSSKHLAYFAYGLPVLVPAWRRRLDLLRGSVPYDEQSFLSIIASLHDEHCWQTISDDAYAQGQRLNWERTLRPLEALVESLPARASS